MPGFILIDKPKGITSHDVIDRIRAMTGQKRIGHAGTLDPFATGLLLVAIEREATRELSKFVGLDKEYVAEFRFGGQSDTDDRTGNVTKVESDKVTKEDIEAALEALRGEIKQIPPAYSAIKIGGKKMYEAAREGKPLKAKSRSVTIHAFEILHFDQENNALEVRIVCSSGTYIRSLARDLGQKLGIGGYVQELRRTKIGPFTVDDALSLETLKKDGVQGHLKPIESTLDSL